MKKILPILLMGIFLLHGCKVSNENPDGEIVSQQNFSESINAEIYRAEEQVKEPEKTLYEDKSVTQLDLNMAANEIYEVWDNALNNIWEMLEANLSEADLETLRKEEEEWIIFKETEVQSAAAPYEEVCSL